VKALDTNVLARFFVDDPDDEQAAAQRPAATAAMSVRSWVTVTVLLEFEWVLRGFYELPRTEVLRVIQSLAGIEHVLLEDRDAVLAALEATEAGFDFADALHVLRSHRANSFVTFDRRLARRAADHGMVPPVELLGK
jgi:predicted nucleic-acid-binding protein